MSTLGSVCSQLRSAVIGCQEVVAVLLAKPDEEVQNLVGTQFSQQLKVISELLLNANILSDEALIAEVKSALSAFYEFHRNYFLDLGTGLASPIVQSLLLTLNVTAVLSEKYEKIQVYLVESSHLVQNFFEMEEMKKTLSGDSVASNFIALNLMILYSCSVQNEFHHYFKHFDPVSFLGPFCKSPQFVVKYHSMIIAGNIGACLPSIGTEILQLEDSDVEIIVDLLSKASASDQHEVKGHQCIFSTTELLSGINCLLNDSMNANKLINSDILVTLISILVAGYPDEQKQAVLLMWSLANRVCLMETVSALDLPLIDVLWNLESTEDPHLKLATYGLLSHIDASSKPNPEACYAYHHYEQCVMQCDDILSSESKFGLPIEAVRLCKGKSLYKLFRRQQSSLLRSILDDKHFRMKLGVTYSIAKEAILVFDKTVLDTESSQMFDLAMMEYASTMNRLGEIQRCLLCRCKAKLLRSHYCPHSILREFCSGLTVPENLRVFDTTAEVGHSKSPKEATVYAFCKSCENVFSLNGEQDFVPNFFRKIYCKSNLTIHSEGVGILYRSWLYHFCVGMLFRALIKQSIEKYCNCQEIYNFFLQCRQVLLNPSLQGLDSADLPEVYILIGPHKARDEDKAYGFVNQVLNDAYFSLLWTSNRPPYSAQFLLVHVGIIYIIKHFSSSLCELPLECKIDPESGIFLVPPEDNRCDYFTEKWWDVVRAVALERSKKWLERPLVPLKKMQQAKMVSPAQSLDSLFHVSSSVYADLEVFQESIVPSPDPQNPRIVSFLPPGFGFRPGFDPTNILVPKEHQILLHYPINDRECYFMAVGNDDPYYAFTNPYVIYTHCEPGLQVSIGFFIDPKTLKFVDFLPIREGKAMLERLAVVDRLKEEVCFTMTKCLKSKGIKDLGDVLHLLELDPVKLSIDTKCFGAYCWYCIDKCCFCLKASGSEYSNVTSGEKILRYCSVECMKKLKEVSPLQLSVMKPEKELEQGTNMRPEFLRVKIQGSGILPNDELPAVVNVNVLLYVEKSIEEIYPVSLFYSCRSHHLQTFCYYNDVSSLSDLLTLEKSTFDLNEGIISLLLNFCRHHQMSVMNSKQFYCALSRQYENAPLSMVSTVYSMLLPVLKVSMLDINLITQNHETTNGEPDCARAVKTGLVTEYQFRKLEEILPHNCALTVEFTNQIRTVHFNNCNSVPDSSFCSLVKQVCSILISRIDALLEADEMDDIKSNEGLCDKLTQLCIKIELCLAKIPSMMNQDVCDMAGRQKF